MVDHLREYYRGETLPSSRTQGWSQISYCGLHTNKSHCKQHHPIPVKGKDIVKSTLSLKEASQTSDLKTLEITTYQRTLSLHTMLCASVKRTGLFAVLFFLMADNCSWKCSHISQGIGARDRQDLQTEMKELFFLM